jgi:ATP-dependent exoDNAse (exonuclease V) beta subunit
VVLNFAIGTFRKFLLPVSPLGTVFLRGVLPNPHLTCKFHFVLTFVFCCPEQHLCRLCQVNFCDDCTPHRYRISRQDSDPQRVCGPCLVGVAAVNRDSSALSNLSIALLKQAGAARGIDLRTCFDKSSIVDTLITQIIMRLPPQPRPAEPPRPAASRSQPPPPQQQRSASSNSFQQPAPASAAAPRSQPPPASQPSVSSSSSSSTSNLQEKPISQSNSSSQANYDNLDAPEIDTTKMGAKQLREFLEKYGIDSRDCFDKESLVDLAKRVATDRTHTSRNLVASANVTKTDLVLSCSTFSQRHYT